MTNNKLFRIGSVIVGIALMLIGGYRLYMTLGGEAKRENENAQKSAVFIGETATDADGVEFCVTSVNEAKTIGSDYSKITTENNFIVVSIRITNNSREAYDVNCSHFVLTENGNEYECYSDALLRVENHMYLDTINPFISGEYVIVYEVPGTLEEREWQMKIIHNVFSDKDFVYVNLREK